MVEWEALAELDRERVRYEREVRAILDAWEAPPAEASPEYWAGVLAGYRVGLEHGRAAPTAQTMTTPRVTRV